MTSSLILPSHLHIASLISYNLISILLLPLLSSLSILDSFLPSPLLSPPNFLSSDLISIYPVTFCLALVRINLAPSITYCALDENKQFVEHLLGGILLASRFTKPLRPVFLYRPRTDKSLSEEPEFILQLVPALSVEDSKMTPADFEKRQIEREEEGMTSGELDHFNRFCNVKRLHMHIKKVNELADQLKAWAHEMEVPLSTSFVAAQIKSFARPHYSETHLKKNMEVSDKIQMPYSCTFELYSRVPCRAVQYIFLNC